VPVIAPAAGGPPEIVDEHCARLYPPGDPAAAARALIEVLGDGERRARMAAAARARAERELDANEARRGYREALATAARNRPQGGVRLPAAARPPGAPGSGLALVTVTHDSEPELRALLDSVARWLPGAEVVVVDSGSRDGSVEAGRERASTVIELGENVGFGRGVNAGLGAVEQPVTAIANPDVELVDASLAACAREALRTGRPDRILAPLVLLPDGRRQDVAQRTPASAPLVLHALSPGDALPPPLAAAVEPWRAGTPRRAGWAVAACLVARTGTLRRLGPFDERTFLYGEDLDLGLRAAAAGVETWFWPGARVLHRRAHATRRAFGGEPVELLARRRREVVEARLGHRRLVLDDALQALTFADRLVLKSLLGRDASRERRQLAALRAARRERH
jgi:GT2 family glycosyltransferase